MKKEIPEELRKLRDRVDLLTDRSVMAAVRTTTAKRAFDDSLHEEKQLKHELEQALDKLTEYVAGNA